MNPVEELCRHAQSLWLDYISRGMIRTGELKRLIEQSGITGLTSKRCLHSSHTIPKAPSSRQPASGTRSAGQMQW